MIKDIKKEEFEWIHSWCDKTELSDKPRVLLIGDSITYGYQEIVRENLKDICYVDYISSAYSADRKLYKNLITTFYEDSSYDLVHFNFGLHGIHLSKDEYKNSIIDLLKNFKKKSKLVLATTTVVYEEGNKELSNLWTDKVTERNQAINELAKDLNCEVDELYNKSLSVPKELRYVDGTHYLKDGYKLLAESVSDIISKILKK